MWALWTMIHRTRTGHAASWGGVADPGALMAHALVRRVACSSSCHQRLWGKPENRDEGEPISRRGTLVLPRRAGSSVLPCICPPQSCQKPRNKGLTRCSELIAAVQVVGCAGAFGRYHAGADGCGRGASRVKERALRRDDRAPEHVATQTALVFHRGAGLDIEIP